MDQAQFLNVLGWDEFLAGDWVREAPAKPGRYPIADAAGLDAGTIVVLDFNGKLLYVKGQMKDTNPAEIWAGWWWSAPQPPLPPAPPIMPKE